MTENNPTAPARPRFHVLWSEDVVIMMEKCIGTESILQAVFAEAFEKGEARIPASAPADQNRPGRCRRNRRAGGCGQ